jgi:hypothetical protein
MASSFLIVADDIKQGPAGFESTIDALLVLGSCNQVGLSAMLPRPRKHFHHRTPSSPVPSLQAKLSFPHGAIEIEVTGSFASVQPQRRGRGSTRGGGSSWWPDGFQWLLQAHISTSRELDMLTRSPVSRFAV